jgi:hypothetical protein
MRASEGDARSLEHFHERGVTDVAAGHGFHHLPHLPPGQLGFRGPKFPDYRIHFGIELLNWDLPLSSAFPL